MGRLLKLIVLGAGAVLVTRAILNAAQDVRRYNTLREMSGDGPVWSELPEMTLEILKNERQASLDLPSLLSDIPADIQRYARIKAM